MALLKLAIIIASLVDGLTQKRTDGALIRVNNPVLGNPETPLQTRIEFIKLVFPLLKEYIPN
jgi:hypothetical protein